MYILQTSVQQHFLGSERHVPYLLLFPLSWDRDWKGWPWTLHYTQMRT